MPLPEGYLPKRHDVLLIKAEVSRDHSAEDLADNNWVSCMVEGRHSTALVPLEAIHSLHLRHFDEGDEVELECGSRGIVRAIHDDQLWVETAGLMETWPAIKVSPAPEIPESCPSDLANKVDAVVAEAMAK